MTKTQCWFECPSKANRKILLCFPASFSVMMPSFSPGKNSKHYYGFTQPWPTHSHPRANLISCTLKVFACFIQGSALSRLVTWISHYGLLPGLPIRIVPLTTWLKLSSKWLFKVSVRSRGRSWGAECLPKMHGNLVRSPTLQDKQKIGNQVSLCYSFPLCWKWSLNSHPCHFPCPSSSTSPQNSSSLCPGHSGQTPLLQLSLSYDFSIN